jgi:hypothetical protein
MAKIKKGEEYWCLLARLGKPRKGKVISLTSVLSKQIGLEFSENVSGHSCDGKGKNGYCLWCRAEHLATDEQMEKMDEQEKRDAVVIASRQGEEVDEIDI